MPMGEYDRQSTVGTAELRSGEEEDTDDQTTH